MGKYKDINDRKRNPRPPLSAGGGLVGSRPIGKVSSMDFDEEGMLSSVSIKFNNRGKKLLGLR